MKSIILPDEVVMSKIYLIRNIKVMLDRDLAELFEVKAIHLREQVKINLEKLSLLFMFQLTIEEVEIMVSQNAIPIFLFCNVTCKASKFRSSSVSKLRNSRSV